MRFLYAYISVFLFDLFIRLISIPQKNITIVDDWIKISLSSTVIRRNLKRGHSVKYLMNDAVIDYIHENGLYDSNSK